MSKKSGGNGIVGTILFWVVVFMMIARLLGHNLEDKINFNIQYYTTMLVQKGKEAMGLAPKTANTPIDTKRYLSIAKDWSFEDLPDYYRVIGTSGINPETFPERGKIQYGQLDSLGRTTASRGSLTFENVKGSYGKRQEIPETEKPSGYRGNETYRDTNTGKMKLKTYDIAWKNGKVYRGVMFNKSHNIADRLGGDAIQENLVTGTRNQNVGGVDQKGGMKYAETKAVEYIESHHDAVLYYESIPIYEGNEIIPRGVLVNMKSSDGKIDEAVMTYNVANGYTINYNDGTFTKNK